MPKIRVDGKVHNHKVVSEQQWLVARKTLLAKEKQYTRLGDRLNRERRGLPWVKVDSPTSSRGRMEKRRCPRSSGDAAS
jgi:predicted dithiol-disulfide oxidoreductase (DUF899 family)